MLFFFFYKKTGQGETPHRLKIHFHLTCWVLKDRKLEKRRKKSKKNNKTENMRRNVHRNIEGEKCTHDHAAKLLESRLRGKNAHQGENQPHDIPTRKIKPNCKAQHSQHEKKLWTLTHKTSKVLFSSIVYKI